MNWNSTITKEMADYSAMKSNLEKKNIHYFASSPNSEIATMPVIHHIPSDTPAEDISNCLEDLGLNIINVRQLTTNRRSSNGQAHVEILPLLLVVTLTRNIKSQEIFHLNSLNHVIIIESNRAQIGLTQCYVQLQKL
jgi:hypothetical protein